MSPPTRLHAPTSEHIPARTFAIALLLLALPTASLVLAPAPTPSPRVASVARAAPRATLGCTGAITLAAGVEIIGAFAGTAVSETVDVGVRCDGADVVRVRHMEGSGIGSCRRPVPANLDLPWQPLVGSAFTVTLYIPGNFVDQTVWAQFQTASGTLSPVFCDDVVSEGMPPQPTWDPRTPTAERTTPVWNPTRDPRTPTETATGTGAPIPTGTPSPTRTYGPSPTPSPGPTSTPRTAAVHGRILLANGAATINGALGSAIDVPLALDLTGEGAPLCLMRLRLSGGGCREDAGGRLAGLPWQAFRRDVALNIPLALDGVTISAWVQVGNAAGEVSRAFCDDVRVHAPHTATPGGGSPTPRVSTPLPPVTPCPRWHAPVHLPVTLRNPATHRPLASIASVRRAAPAAVDPNDTATLEPASATPPHPTSTSVPRPTRRPSGVPTRTATPPPVPAVVSGSVAIEPRYNTGGFGQRVPVPARFSAKSQAGPVCEMRVAIGYDCQWLSETWLAESPWQPYRTALTFETNLPGGPWGSVSVTAQFRTADDRRSEVVCAKLQLHSHASPEPWPTSTPGPPPTPTPTPTLQPVTPCPRWTHPLFLPNALRATTPLIAPLLAPAKAGAWLPKATLSDGFSR